MTSSHRLSIAVRRPVVNMAPKPTPLTYIGEGGLQSEYLWALRQR